jgi:hypothetical protein
MAFQMSNMTFTVRHSVIIDDKSSKIAWRTLILEEFFLG